jgi:hypothetical protein
LRYFFRPVELAGGNTGKTATIVEGGTLSNFPAWLFDTARRDHVRPTFGLRLIGGRAVGSGLRRFVRVLGLADTATSRRWRGGEVRKMLP